MTDIVTRCAKAAQDNQIHFGPTKRIGPNVTETRVMHSPGPAARQEAEEAYEAAQKEANGLLATGRGTEARALLIAVCEAQTAMYPQYRNKWDDHDIGVMRKQWKGKGGVRALRGDAVLYRRCEDRSFPLTCRTARGDCDFAADESYIREVV